MNQQIVSAIRRAKKTPKHLLSQFYIAANIISLAFGLLIGQRKKQHGDVHLENIFPMVEKVSTVHPLAAINHFSFAGS